MHFACFTIIYTRLLIAKEWIYIIATENLFIFLVKFGGQVTELFNIYKKKKFINFKHAIFHTENIIFITRLKIDF